MANNSNNNNNNIFNSINEDVLIVLMRYITVNDALNLLKIGRRSQSLIRSRLTNLSVMNRYTIKGINWRRITKSKMCAILTNCRNVKQIDLRNIELIDEETEEPSADDTNNNSIVLSIANGCPNVESIDFDALQVNHNFELLVENCRKLKNISSKTINDESLKDILDRLESLDLSQNPNITEQLFDDFGPNLKEINLNNSYIDLFPAIQRLSHGYGKQIEKLTVYIKNPLVMPVINGDFVNLTHLSLYVRCMLLLSQYLTTTNFPRLSKLSVNVDCLPELLRAETSFPIPKLNITASLLNSVHQEFYTLLNYCNQIFSRQLKKVAIHTPIRFANIQFIQKYIPDNLKSLDLMGCDNITDLFAQNLIKRNRNLCQLSLHNCPLVGLLTLSAFTALSYEFSLDVINTSIRRCDVPNRLRSNLSIMVDVSDCVYGCPH